MDRRQVEKISKALADATRLRIFEAIASKDEMNCGELVSMRGVTPATVSHHLRILQEASLIACRREGQFVFNLAIPATIEAYTRALSEMACGSRNHRAAPSADATPAANRKRDRTREKEKTRVGSGVNP